MCHPSPSPLLWLFIGQPVSSPPSLLTTTDLHPWPAPALKRVCLLPLLTLSPLPPWQDKLQDPALLLLLLILAPSVPDPIPLYSTHIAPSSTVRGQIGQPADLFLLCWLSDHGRRVGPLGSSARGSKPVGYTAGQLPPGPGRYSWLPKLHLLQQLVWSAWCILAAAVSLSSASLGHRSCCRGCEDSLGCAVAKRRITAPFRMFPVRQVPHWDTDTYLYPNRRYTMNRPSVALFLL